jgi:coenzyme F420 hydrogenase subunit beta
MTTMNDERGVVKDFRDLKVEVQDRGICGKCGGCVSFCSAGEFNALELDREGKPVLVNERACLKCGICYLVCPQVRVLNQELRQRFGWKPLVGSYRSLASARATSSRIRKVATDGGVVTALLTYALKRHLIQAGVVLRKTGPFSREPAIATTPSELVDAAGSHFEESLHLDTVGRRYSTFAPMIREVKNLKVRNLERIAVVATPCQVYTIRKMQLLSVVPADAIVLTIGLFCMENFSFDEKARARIEKRLGVKLKKLRKVNIKDDVILETQDRKTLHVPFAVVDEIARPACLACADFANDFADISCGGLGSPDGYTTAIVRTALGERVYNGARQAHLIEELRSRDKDEAKTHKTEAMGRVVSFARRKRERAKKRLGHAD